MKNVNVPYACYNLTFRVDSSHSSLDTTIQHPLHSTRVTSRLEVPGSTHMQANDVLRHNVRFATLFASVLVIEPRQAPVVHQPPKADDAVCRRVRSPGLRARRPHVGPVRTDRHRNERPRWAGSYRHWRLQRWPSDPMFAGSEM